MKILFINNNGGGFADFTEITTGTTVEQFFKNQFSGEDSADYLIRVNRQPVPRDYVLQENDRVTVTPVKVEGAVAV
jgi:sulfur carrier protein ThiS